MFDLLFGQLHIARDCSCIVLAGRLFPFPIKCDGSMCLVSQLYLHLSMSRQFKNTHRSSPTQPDGRGKGGGTGRRQPERNIHSRSSKRVDCRIRVMLCRGILIFVASMSPGTYELPLIEFETTISRSTPFSTVQHSAEWNQCH